MVLQPELSRILGWKSPWFSMQGRYMWKIWGPRGLLAPLSDFAFFPFLFIWFFFSPPAPQFWTAVDLFGMCCSFRHGCTQQFLACWAVLLHCRVVLASFCWEITGHTRCQENVGKVRETGIVLIAMNSNLLMVGLMKSVPGTHHSLRRLTMSIAWTLETFSKPPGPGPTWSSQIDPRYLQSKCRPPETSI